MLSLAVLSILCGYLATKVKINYDLAALSSEGRTPTVAIDKVMDEYTS